MNNCILLQWIMDITPSVAQRKSMAKGLIPKEAYFTALRVKPFKFHRIWDPFLKCLINEVCRGPLYDIFSVLIFF